jgi:DNA polymerase-4
VASIAPDIEDRGIDEIYIDLTDVAGETRELARASSRPCCGHRADLFDRRHAQQAAVENLLRPGQAQRPDRAGLTDPARIWPLGVRKVNGIGPKATAKLAALGIDTIGQLARPMPACCRTISAHYAAWLRARARGIDERGVHQPRKQVDLARNHLRARPACAHRPRGCPAS